MSNLADWQSKYRSTFNAELKRLQVDDDAALFPGSAHNFLNWVPGFWTTGRRLVVVSGGSVVLVKAQTGTFMPLKVLDTVSASELPVRPVGTGARVILDFPRGERIRVGGIDAAGRETTEVLLQALGHR
jgi:hypothetical protein